MEEEGGEKSTERGWNKDKNILTKEGDKDTNIQGEVELERDRKKENVEEKRREREGQN